MVEGPGVHRVAIAHRRVLVGKPFSATSPSGRFAEGASAINGRYLSLIEVHGKNIFYFFTREKLEQATLAKLPDDVIVVHIHFGMSGSFRTFDSPGPEPREKTRLKLENIKEKIVAHLSAQLCLHGNFELYKKRITELGPDPLRDDADKETVWRKMQKSKKTIGGLIMDQSFIAGIGNIYRTEILFVIGVHPDQRVSTLTRSTFEELWSHSVRLLKVGVVTGSITTVSPEEAGKPYSKLKSGERRYVYSHETCMRCGGPVRSWPSASRTVYACEVCQPLREVNDNGVDKTVGEDALDGQMKKPRSRARVASTKTDSEGTRTEETKKTSVKKTKESSTTIKFRKRKIMDGRIVEHQALKDIPAGGLVDFPGNLDDLTWPSVSSKTPNKSSSLSDSQLVLSQAMLLSSRIGSRIASPLTASTLLISRDGRGYARTATCFQMMLLGLGIGSRIGSPIPSSALEICRKGTVHGVTAGPPKKLASSGKAFITSMRFRSGTCLAFLLRIPVHGIRCVI